MIEQTVAFLVLLLVIAVVAEPLAEKLRLPHSSMLVILGAFTAWILTQVLHIDTGLRAASFHDLIFFVLLPALIFEAAYKIPLPELKTNLPAILLLAIVGMLLTTVIAAAMLFAGIGHPTGFPWITALLAGALLAATDPVAVVAQLKSLGAPEDLAVLLEGESLFNDATAIVVFGIFLSLAMTPELEVTPIGAVLNFGTVFFGGSIIGALIGGVAALGIRLNGDVVSRTVLTLCAAFGSFLIAEAWLHVSGVMASLVAGIVMANVPTDVAINTSRPNGDHSERAPDQSAVNYFWSMMAYLANGCVFLLMGMTITLAMFEDRWLAMIIAIVAVLIARLVSTFGVLALLNPITKHPVPLNYQTVITWGGLRGAVTLALALSLPVDLDYWYTIQSMAFGVVLFTLFIQAPTMPWLLKRTNVAGSN